MQYSDQVHRAAPTRVPISGHQGEEESGMGHAQRSYGVTQAVHHLRGGRISHSDIWECRFLAALQVKIVGGVADDDDGGNGAEGSAGSAELGQIGLCGIGQGQVGAARDGELSEGVLKRCGGVSAELP